MAAPFGLSVLDIVKGIELAHEICSRCLDRRNGAGKCVSTVPTYAKKTSSIREGAFTSCVKNWLMTSWGQTFNISNLLTTFGSYIVAFVSSKLSQVTLPHNPGNQMVLLSKAVAQKRVFSLLALETLIKL